VGKSGASHPLRSATPAVKGHICCNKLSRIFFIDTSIHLQRPVLIYPNLHHAPTKIVSSSRQYGRTNSNPRVRRYLRHYLRRSSWDRSPDGRRWARCHRKTSPQTATYEIRRRSYSLGTTAFAHRPKRSPSLVGSQEVDSPSQWRCLRLQVSYYLSSKMHCRAY
jgi:hypothetical protein